MGSYDDHAKVRILRELKLTDDAETELICSPIYHHDDKMATDDPMDKILKNPKLTIKRGYIAQWCHYSLFKFTKEDPRRNIINEIIAVFVACRGISSGE